MSWQHHARFVPGTNETELTLFDNHGLDSSRGKCRSTGTCSRGLRLALTTTTPTVQLLQQYLHPASLRSKNQGSMQLLPASGNAFIGWGHSPAFSEHLATGETVLDVQFAPWPDNVTPAPDNYRAYKMDWAATPWWDPAVAVRANAQGDLNVYASWNGATEVREWVVRGNEGGVLARARRMGFETQLSVGPRVWVRRLWVEALDGDGVVLRASERLDLEDEDVEILMEGEEFDGAVEQNVVTPASRNHGSWVFFGAGLVGLGVTVVWRRRRDYQHVPEDDMSDLDSDADVEDVYLDINA